MSSKVSALSVMAGLFLATGCHNMAGSRVTHPMLRAAMSPVGGYAARGKVTFTQMGDETLVEASFAGLKPGLHGLHIHEFGDCAGNGAEAAGGHFNPMDKPHGMTDAEHHRGDLGNVHADANGYAMESFKVTGLTFMGDQGINARSVVLHADPDDLVTQPSGNSGARISCGVIAEVSE